MVRFIDVTKTYDTGNEALKGVSFRIEDGEFVFLVGPSGSGKSTVTKLLTAEIAATSGRVMVNGYNLNNIHRRQIPYLRRTLGVVFQDFRLMNNKTVWENLAFVMRVVGSSPHAMRKRIPYVLELVGLSGKERELPSQLSGGEQQRLAIARALVNNPEMIIADEPTANVDPSLSVEIMELLAQINDLGTTMLVVTHEKGLVDRLGKRVIAIRDGRILRDETGGYYPDHPAAPAMAEEEPEEEFAAEEPAPAEEAEAEVEAAAPAEQDDDVDAVPAEEPTAGTRDDDAAPVESGDPSADGPAPDEEVEAEAEPAEEDDDVDAAPAEETAAEADQSAPAGETAAEADRPAPEAAERPDQPLDEEERAHAGD